MVHPVLGDVSVPRSMLIVLSDVLHDLHVEDGVSVVNLRQILRDDDTTDISVEWCDAGIWHIDTLSRMTE